MTVASIDLTQRLAGRVAVITGGGSGIGLATARRFAAEVLPLVAAGAVRATVDGVYPLARIAEAHARLEANQSTGKLVLTLA